MAKDLSKSEASPAPSALEGDPFGAFRGEMNRLIDSFFGGGFMRPLREFEMPDLGLPRGVLVPNLDVKENGKEINISAELPGLDESDVDVSVQDSVLTIKGEKKLEKSDKGDNYRVMERRYGSFQRALQLPEAADLDKIEASFEKGVLAIRVPKRADKARPEKKVRIKRA